VIRAGALAVAVLVFTWPDFSAHLPGTQPAYAVVTVAFTALLVAIVVAWDRADEGLSSGTLRPPAAVVAMVATAAACIVVVAAYRWTRVSAWQPYGADMLIVIREATRRFLNGRTPYAVYRSYDAPWNMVMPYGPALWAPFLVPQILRLDFRLLTIAGELFVPVWCGVAAVVESARGEIAAAVSWLAVLAALVVAFDVQGFTVIGHTPAYWPLLPLFAVMMARGRWIGAAVLLGLLVAARTTMVAVIPVFVMAVWHADRRRVPIAAGVLVMTIAAIIGPFVIWDHRAVWDNMVLSYPRVMKEAVWPVLAREGLETIGLTEWLVEHHREGLVTPVQLTVMVGLYAAAWRATQRGVRPLPWMALALMAFSMTTFYPVHYLYYDVLLLLVSAAVVETLATGRARMRAPVWFASLGAIVALLFCTTRAVMSPFPHAAVGEITPDRPLRTGFAGAETDGRRSFSWVVGTKATILLPRSSASAAMVMLTAQSPFGPNDAPQRVTAILNGRMLDQRTVSAGWQEIRFPAPRPAWWVGFNVLQLEFSSTVTPREAGAGDDPRALALGISRVDVVPVER
jgi:hypothetical protein